MYSKRALLGKTVMKAQDGPFTEIALMYVTVTGRLYTVRAAMKHLRVASLASVSILLQ